MIRRMTPAGPDSSVLSVRVHPRTSMNRHELSEDGVLHIWLTAPAVDGAANKALNKYLAAILAIPGSQIRLVSGETSRQKRIRFPMDKDELIRRVTNTQPE
jgi:uncharacterized protein